MLRIIFSFLLLITFVQAAESKDDLAKAPGVAKRWLQAVGESKARGAAAVAALKDQRNAVKGVVEPKLVSDARAYLRTYGMIEVDAKENAGANKISVLCHDPKDPRTAFAVLKAGPRAKREAFVSALAREMEIVVVAESHYVKDLPMRGTKETFTGLVEEFVQLVPLDAEGIAIARKNAAWIKFFEEEGFVNKFGAMSLLQVKKVLSKITHEEKDPLAAEEIRNNIDRIVNPILVQHAFLAYVLLRGDMENRNCMLCLAPNSLVPVVIDTEHAFSPFQDSLSYVFGFSAAGLPIDKDTRDIVINSWPDRLVAEQKARFVENVGEDTYKETLSIVNALVAFWRDFPEASIQSTFLFAFVGVPMEVGRTVGSWVLDCYNQYTDEGMGFQTCGLRVPSQFMENIATGKFFVKYHGYALTDGLDEFRQQKRGENFTATEFIDYLVKSKHFSPEADAATFLRALGRPAMANLSLGGAA